MYSCKKKDEISSEAASPTRFLRSHEMLLCHVSLAVSHMGQNAMWSRVLTENRLLSNRTYAFWARIEELLTTDVANRHFGRSVRVPPKNL